MIVWINGPFGGGKTTTARLLHQAVDGSLIYDPEEVGSMLRRILPGRERDFQDLPPWRSLTAATAIQLHAYNQERPVIAPMTLLNQAYAHEIFDRVQAAGIRLHHLLLHADTATVSRRIERSMEFPDDAERSEQVRAFRQRKLPAYTEAYTSWLPRKSAVVDTTELTPEQVAERALEIVSSSG
ncbi:AAA family ATPase [Streptomyces sp. NPDC021100]|uniref:AAA family ATPase n=1 Tax=Streptomyces sp. NPDC021100 TaxID=3365114 RepID=UPI0037885EA9